MRGGALSALASAAPGADASLVDRATGPGTPCKWCNEAIPVGKKPEAETCSKRCRQAHWRFKVAACELEAAEQPMRFAYADPPYPGKSFYYPERQEVDHEQLVDQMVNEYPDGWCLSTSGEALRTVWALCPASTRLHVWVKAPRRTRSRRALSSFEALLVTGGRPLRADVVQDLSDTLVARGRFRSFPGALVGMKPPAFAEWMFRLLGARPGDQLDDLFPGSGAIGKAWELYMCRPSTSPAGDASRLQAERRAA